MAGRLLFTVAMAFVWKLASADGDQTGQYFIPALPSRRIEALPPAPRWQAGLPELECGRATLRELKDGDGMALFTAVMNHETTRFISPPPASVDGFEQFIGWVRRERADGHGAAFAVVPRGSDHAVGLFQLRSPQSDCANVEWGFLIASEFWGSGLFADTARLVMEFAFDRMGVRRLEARAATRNLRANAALRKLGAVREGMLRKSFVRHGEVLDQAMWTIIADDWRAARHGSMSPVIH